MPTAVASDELLQNYRPLDGQLRPWREGRQFATPPFEWQAAACHFDAHDNKMTKAWPPQSQWAMIECGDS